MALQPTNTKYKIEKFVINTHKRVFSYIQTSVGNVKMSF